MLRVTLVAALLQLALANETRRPRTNAGDGFCTSGVIAWNVKLLSDHIRRDVCCAKACGTCGGKDCRRRSQQAAYVGLCCTHPIIRGSAECAQPSDVECSRMAMHRIRRHTNYSNHTRRVRDRSNTREAAREGVSCPSLPPSSLPEPTPEVPLFFFHLRKVGGSELRTVLAKVAVQRRLSYFIPCFAGRPGSWLQLLTSSRRPGIRRRCNIHGIDSLLERSLTPSESTFMQTAPALYAGHLPYHVSSQFGASGWELKRQVSARPSRQRFSCILAVREPVGRFQSCYKERHAASMGGRPLNNLTRAELLEVFKRTDGMHSCSNEIARWIAPTAGWGESRLSEPGVILSAEELAETHRRMDQCVVVNMVEDCAGTVKVLMHVFPWLAGAITEATFCSQLTREHATSYSPEWATSDVTQVRDWRWHMIALHNLEDIRLYRRAMRRFRCLLDRAQGATQVLPAKHSEPAAETAARPHDVVSKLPSRCSVTPMTTGPRIAVSLYGVARSDAPLASTYKNLVQPLQQVGAVDLFIHLMQPHLFFNRRTKEHNVRAYRSERFITALSPCAFGITDQGAADVELTQAVQQHSEDLVGHGNPFVRHKVIMGYRVESIRNLFRSRLSMRESARLVEAHMQSYSVVYTHIALVRPDVIYETPLVFDPNDARAQVRVPDWGHDFCDKGDGGGGGDANDTTMCTFSGVNDRFAIGALPVLLPLALGRLAHLQRYSLVRNSEHLWCNYLAEARVTVGLVHGMRIIRIRAPDGQYESKDVEAPLPMPPLACAKHYGLKLVDDWNATTRQVYAQSLSSQLESKPWCAACLVT